MIDGLGRGGERTITAHTLLQIPNLRQRGILAAGAQQVAEGVEGDAAVAAFVEEGEGFFEVGALRLVFAHRVSFGLRWRGFVGVRNACRRVKENAGEVMRFSRNRRCGCGDLLTQPAHAKLS